MVNTPTLSISGSSNLDIPSRMDDSRPSSSIKSKSSSFHTVTSMRTDLRELESVVYRDSYLVSREDSFFSKYKFSFPRGRYARNAARKHKFGLGMKVHDSMEDDYDYQLKRQYKTASIGGGIAALVKGCVGGGMVSLHESYKECGMLTALILNIVLGVLVSFCMYEMTRSSQKLYARTNLCIMSYPDMIEAICEFSDWFWLRKLGRPFRHAVEFLICVDLFGACCVFQVMIARALYQLVEGSEGQKKMDLETVRLYLAILFIPCAIIGVMVPMKNLAPFSIILNFFIVVISLATIYYSAKAKKSVLNPLQLPFYRSLDGMFELVGNTLFAMDGVGVSLAVENNIKNPKDFPLVVIGGMPIVMAFGMIIGAFGYWGWGEECLSPITLNFPWAPLAIPLKMFIAMVMYVTFGISFWVPASIVWDYVSYFHDPDTHYMDEKIWRFGLVVMTIFVAATFPNISKFLAMLGCFCLSMMSFVIPALISLILDWEKPGLGVCYWRVWKTAFLVILGLVIFLLGTTINAIYLFYQVMILGLSH